LVALIHVERGKFSVNEHSGNFIESFRNLALNTIRSYSLLGKPIINIITADIFIQLVFASFMQISLIYMAKCGYTDTQSADFISFRFLGALILSLPLGFFIRGRRIVPIFYVASVATTVVGFVILYAIEYHTAWLLYSSLFVWGLCFTSMRVTVLPFILRNAPKDVHIEAISLSSSTWALGSIMSGVAIYCFSRIAPDLYDEKRCLQIIVLIGLISFFCIANIRINEKIPEKESYGSGISTADWIVLMKATVPTFLLALGAGLSMPFMGLFFFKVHRADSSFFAILTALSTSLVLVAFLLIPYVRNRFGDAVTIISSQVFAIALLVLMAITELFNTASSAVTVAAICYVVRQPLMNLATPLTTNFTMKYVNRRNQETMCALESAVWTGSWFISSRVFMHLRSMNIEYVYIFLITAIIYSCGVVWYCYLLLDYGKRVEMGMSEC
jgi:Major Facilitator Superfamily